MRPLADLSVPTESVREWSRYRRAFGLPTGLADADRVDLVIEGSQGPGRVWLNDLLLGDLHAAGLITRFPIRDRLKNRNQLVLIVASPLPPANAGGSNSERSPSTQSPSNHPGEVKLEIHSALVSE